MKSGLAVHWLSAAQPAHPGSSSLQSTLTDELELVSLVVAEELIALLKREFARLVESEAVALASPPHLLQDFLHDTIMKSGLAEH